MSKIGYHGLAETDGKQECLYMRKIVRKVSTILYPWCTYVEIAVYNMANEYSVLDQVRHCLLTMAWLWITITAPSVPLGILLLATTRMPLHWVRKSTVLSRCSTKTWKIPTRARDLLHSVPTPTISQSSARYFLGLQRTMK